MRARVLRFQRSTLTRGGAALLVGLLTALATIAAPARPASAAPQAWHGDPIGSSEASKQACADFLNYIATTPVQENYYKAFNAPPVNTEAQSAVKEPYLQEVLKAYNAAPFVSQWLDTLYGQNVGNALNVGVVNMLAGKSDPAGIVQAVNQAAKKG